MDLNATPFRFFLKVAELGSFTRAAESLHTSQPALSASIKELERRLGFPLFDRTSRRVSLTREGQAFAVSAKRIVLETEWMNQRARDIRNTTLRIAVPHYSALIPERTTLTDSFSNDPSRRSVVQIVSLDHAQIYDAVRSEDADVAMVIEPMGAGELSPLSLDSRNDFEIASLARKPLGFFVPDTHPLHGRDHLDQTALQGRDVATINRIHGAALASSVMRQLEALGANALRLPEGDALSLMRYAADRGVLAVDLGWFPPGPDVGQLSLKRIRLVDPDVHSQLVMLRRRDGRSRPDTDTFWNYALGEGGCRDAGPALPHS